MKCNRIINHTVCRGKMVNGKVIANGYVDGYGTPARLRGRGTSIRLNGTPVLLENSFKCEKCGHTVVPREVVM